MGAACPVRTILAAASLALVAALTLSAAPGSAAEKRLTRPEARAYAAALLRENRPAAARAVARGLLQADAGDFKALIILARAETELGRFQQAEAAARRAHEAARTDDQRFIAAYSVSQALTGQDRFTAAQWWLRRAGNTTDNPRLDAAARSQFRRVQNANPWRINARLSFSPSSNVNNGPTTNTFQIGDFVFVDPTAVPLSGLEIGARLSIFRYARPQKHSRFYFGLTVDDRRFALSSAARRAVPTARGSDFSYSVLEAHAGWVLPDGDDKGKTEIGLSAGRSWRGGAALLNHARLRIRRSQVLDGARKLHYAISYERQNRLDAAIRSADVVTLSGGYSFPTAQGGRITLGAALIDTSSGSAAITHRAGALSLGYQHGEKIFGALPSLSIGLTAREFDRAIYGPDPRSDRRLTLGAELLFPDLEFYGFAPAIGFTATRNRSNVSAFDSREYGLTFDFRSTF